MYTYELFCAFFPILIYFSLKPLTRNLSYITVYTSMSECDSSDHSVFVVVVIDVVVVVVVVVVVAVVVVNFLVFFTASLEPLGFA